MRIVVVSIEDKLKVDLDKISCECLDVDLSCIPVNNGS